MYTSSQPVISLRFSLQDEHGDVIPLASTATNSGVLHTLGFFISVGIEDGFVDAFATTELLPPTFSASGKEAESWRVECKKQGGLVYRLGHSFCFGLVWFGLAFFHSPIPSPGGLLACLPPPPPSPTAQALIRLQVDPIFLQTSADGLFSVCTANSIFSGPQRELVVSDSPCVVPQVSFSLNYIEVSNSLEIGLASTLDISGFQVGGTLGSQQPVVC